MALKMMGSCMLFLFVFLVEGVFGDAAEVKSVMEGDLVTLNTSVTKQQHDTVRWYFNDILIALINGHPNTSCLYDGEDGRFRKRLEVDYETGSLIITNITTEHAGRYEADIIIRDSSGKSESLNRTSKCNSTKIIHKSSIFVSKISKSFSLTVSADKNEEKLQDVPQDQKIDTSSASGLSPAAVAGVVGVAVAAVAVVVVVGVIYFHRRRSRNEAE